MPNNIDELSSELFDQLTLEQLTRVTEAKGIRATKKAYTEVLTEIAQEAEAERENSEETGDQIVLDLSGISPKLNPRSPEFNIKDYKKAVEEAGGFEAMSLRLRETMEKTNKEIVLKAIQTLTEYTETEQFQQISLQLKAVFEYIEQNREALEAAASKDSEIHELIPYIEQIIQEDFPEYSSYRDVLREVSASGSPLTERAADILDRAKRAKENLEITHETLSQVEQIREELSLFFNVPNSPASNLIMEVLSAGPELQRYKDGKKKINHNTQIELYQDGKRRLVTLANNKADITIELADIDRLMGSNKTAKKLFVLALIKANEQAIHDGRLTKDYISFPLQELVDIGFYTNIRSARAGFNAGAETLTSLKIKGTVKKTQRQANSVDALEVLFTGARIQKGDCFLRFNYAIDWGFIAQYFTILPKYFFKLSSRSGDLLYYIFYLARQHTKDIEEKGYFTISFRAIQQRLQLPNEADTNKTQRDIKQPIEDAITQIEEEHSAYYGNTEFQILSVCDDSAPITRYLDTGYLKITLKGEFSKKFLKISKDTARQITATQKRQEKIVDAAKARLLAQAIEADKKNRST